MILVAEHLDDRRRRVVVDVDERPVRIGRNPADDGHDDVILRVPWNDRLVNRNHSIARRDGDELIVTRLPASPGHHEANRIYSPGSHDSREALEDPLRMKAGDSFVIGRNGRTVFHWLHQIEDLDRERFPESDDADRFDREDDDLAEFNEYTLRLQLRLLQRELPEQVLSGWTDERDLFIRAAAFLHNAFPGQKRVAAAFVALDPSNDDGEFELLSPDPNTRADFQPSRRLLRKLDRRAANGGGPCIWTPATDPAEFAKAPSLQRTIEWIAAVPVCSLDENSAVYRTPDRRPVYIYVETGYSSNPGADNGRANLPFLRLVAALVASLLSTREKQRIQDQMSAYFSPALREKLSEGDQEALEPAMADCTVLFADRRGSSAMMETARSDDEILKQLRDNQEIVGEITQTVFDHDGVITDFSGDGVLALWGWPPDLESRQHHARLAVEAAAAISARLESWVDVDHDSQRRLSPIRIGVSTGRLAVGKTGPEQQLHISVFGNVVNLGARLEKIAKGFHLPVLLSGETVSRLGGREGRVPNVRRLCYIKPAGFNHSYPIFELILPAALGGSGVSPANTEKYERALELFVERQWQEARDLLDQLPEDDRPARWLDHRIEKFQRKPPSDDWQGEIVSLLK